MNNVVNIIMGYYMGRFISMHKSGLVGSCVFEMDNYEKVILLFRVNVRCLLLYKWVCVCLLF